MKNLGVGRLLAMYANLGYVVVATDYSGLGADSGGTVLDMQSNALDVIYSVAAARAAVKEIGRKWIAVGPFQGGLAAVAVGGRRGHDPRDFGHIAFSWAGGSGQIFQDFCARPSQLGVVVLASYF